MIKPPIGVSPSWIVLHERIRELHEAIGRYIEHIDMHRHNVQVDVEYRLIAKWAKELGELANLEASLENLEREQIKNG